MENKDEWVLRSLHINQDWNKQGHYTGSVEFKNGVKMQTSLLLDSEKCSKMIAILQEEVVNSAKTLGDLLIKSMPIQINESNVTDKLNQQGDSVSE